jgi:HD superfamily phosphohydrolase
MVATPKPFVIRDPIHGYLRIAAHERLVVDDPITQRLRYISQTGLAQLVFFEARTSRFAHSLGAMHLASRFFLNALENADEADATDFFKDIRQHINRFGASEPELDELVTTDSVVGGGGLGAARLSFRHKRLRNGEKELRLLAGISEAALRLAALFHDLGHLPFSHDFEHALKEYAADVPANQDNGIKQLLGDVPHETVGHRLANLVFTAIIEKAGRNVLPATRVAFDLAQKILDNPSRYDEQRQPRVKVLGWLHSLVDGEVDVDRADYLLRDGRALGLDFANYDLERLISSLVLVKDKDLGYVTAVEEHGIGALESFCLARSRSVQALVRHHKVAQIAAALRYACVRALQHRGTESFRKDLNTIGAAKALARDEARALLNRFAQYDDVSLLEVLRTLDPGKDELLAAALDVILRRQPKLVSLWKRKGDLYADHKLVDARLRQLNERLDEMFETGEGEDFEERRRNLLSRGVLIVGHKFKPYAVRPMPAGRSRPLKSVIQVQLKGDRKKGKLTAASEVSPLIQSL